VDSPSPRTVAPDRDRSRAGTWTHTGNSQDWVADRETSFANVDVVIAQEAGFFTQQGLDVTLHNFDSGVKVVQAVVANEVAIGGASIEPVVNAAVAGGDIVIIGTYANRLTVSMITPKR
jgi:ABC-type taurine transport system substrate-binding protein